ncbi:hypothetical protein [Phenylobacterium sp.]|uniref:hypothetical protein n=1 Tax=Phenylobacterium sp. TaxID=1871053 RepID=UPI002FD8FEC4
MRRPTEARQPDPRQPAGWVVAVLVERPGQGPQRRYFAIGEAERARAEWTAVDMAIGLGEAVAASPVQGQEPVEALAGLPPARMTRLGLAPGARRDLGDLRPRRWLSP